MRGWTAAEMYGVGPQVPASGIAAPTQAMGSLEDHGGGLRALVDPGNPLVWFGVILLVSVGAAGFAGSVRLGKAKVSAGIDKA